MPQVLVDNPVAAVIIVALMVLLGWGGRGFWISLRKDKREAAGDEVDLMEAVRQVARNALKEMEERAEADRTYYDQQLRDARREIGRLERRVAQLTSVVREAGIEVPPWPKAMATGTEGR